MHVGDENRNGYVKGGPEKAMSGDAESSLPTLGGCYFRGVLACFPGTRAYFEHLLGSWITYFLFLLIPALPLYR